MDYSPKKLMEGDVLWFLRVMIIDIFKFRIVLIGLVALLIVHIASSSIQMYCFLMEPKLFAKYGPHFVGTLYGISAGVLIIWKKKIADTMWDSFDRWDISTANAERENLIRKYIKRLFILIMINNSIGLAAGVLIVIPGSYDEHFFLTPFVVMRWFPSLRCYPTAVILFYKVSLAAMGYSMIIHPYILVYSVQHIKFQILLCKFYMSNAESDFDGVPDDVLANCVSYQSTLSERIRFFLKRHNEFWKWGLALRGEVTGPPFAILATCGFLLGFSIPFIFIQLEQYGNSKLLVSWVVLFSIAAVIAFASLIYSGQLMQDEVESIELELTQIKWYRWNCENRRTLIRFLGAFLVPFKVGFSGKYAINYDLAVGMLKGLYSITSVFLTVVKR